MDLIKMLAHWLLQSTLLLVIPLLHHAVKSELICSSDIEGKDWSGCSETNQLCRNEVSGFELSGGNGGQLCS